MPIHFEDRDVGAEVAGLKSVLIVPCNMCPAVTVSIREEEPFIQLFKGFLKSIPFERYTQNLRLQLEESDIKTDVFKSGIPHQWFLCMWTSRRCKKLHEHAKKYDGVIVPGCSSAEETVRNSVKSTDCKVIEGMEALGIMNAKLKFRFPCDISFDDCKIVPIFRQIAQASGPCTELGRDGTKKR